MKDAEEIYVRFHVTSLEMTKYIAIKFNICLIENLSLLFKNALSCQFYIASVTDEWIGSLLVRQYTPAPNHGLY